MKRPSGSASRGLPGVHPRSSGKAAGQDPSSANQTGPSRSRYRRFVDAYKQHRLDPPEPASATPTPEPLGSTATEKIPPPKSRESLRDYLRWLSPHRTAIIALGIFALITAGLQ